jgi:ATPase subunit of ABC transporter with duplicated ATPase domains
MLLGVVPLTAGVRSVGRRTVLGAIGQGRDAYGRDARLLDEFGSRSGLAPGDARTLLAKFGLGVDHIGRSCSTLSPGERTRVHLAELQASGANVLVLDEPTNHLDLESINALNVALQKFEGTVLLVTHDQDLLEEVGTRVWHFEHGKIVDFKGTYEELTGTAAS